MKQLLQSKTLQIIGLSIMFILVIYLVYLDYKKMHQIIDKSHIEKTFKVFVPIKEDENTIFMETAQNYLKSKTDNKEELYVFSEGKYILHFRFAFFDLRKEEVLAQLNGKEIQFEKELFDMKIDFTETEKYVLWQHFLCVDVHKENQILELKNKKTGKVYYKLIIQLMKPCRI